MTSIKVDNDTAGSHQHLSANACRFVHVTHAEWCYLDFSERTVLFISIVGLLIIYWTAERRQEIMGIVGLMLSGYGASLITCTKRQAQFLFLLLFT